MPSNPHKSCRAREQKKTVKPILLSSARWLRGTFSAAPFESEVCIILHSKSACGVESVARGEHNRICKSSEQSFFLLRVCRTHVSKWIVENVNFDVFIIHPFKLFFLLRLLLSVSTKPQNYFVCTRRRNDGTINNPTSYSPIFFVNNFPFFGCFCFHNM